MKNKTEIMKSVNGVASKAVMKLKKHSPEILVVAGIAGTVVSAVLACKATTKVAEILDETKGTLDTIHEGMETGAINGQEYTTEDGKKDTVVVYAQTGMKLAKLYAPAIILGTLSITSILASNNILRKRNVALGAAYAAIDKSFKEYRGRVIERFGEQVDTELKYGIKAKKGVLTMRIKPRAIATVLCMIFFVGFAVCGVVRSTDKETLEIKQSYPVLAEAEPMIMADLLMESPNLTPEVEKEPDYPLTQEEIDLIALVTMGEAEGETELGKRLVIDTILNRIDHTSFPDTVYDVVYQPNQFSVMWNSRIDRCYVMPEIVELVKEELLERTNYDCVFFMAGGYSKYGEPLFQECCHYFSSYD